MLEEEARVNDVFALKSSHVAFVILTLELVDQQGIIVLELVFIGECDLLWRLGIVDFNVGQL